MFPFVPFWGNNTRDKFIYHVIIDGIGAGGDIFIFIEMKPRIMRRKRCNSIVELYGCLGERKTSQSTKSSTGPL